MQEEVRAFLCREWSFFAERGHATASAANTEKNATNFLCIVFTMSFGTHIVIYHPFL